MRSTPRPVRLLPSASSWSPLLHRSLEIAKAERLDEQAGRAYANLYSLYVEDLKIPEGESIYVDGLAYCDDHDIATFLTCLQGERTHVLERLGRWDQAAALAAGLLEQHGPSPVNRLNPLLSLGTVQARRGDVEGAWTLSGRGRVLGGVAGRAGVRRPS